MFATKRTVWIIAVVTICLCVLSSGAAADSTPMKKAVRGAVNIISAPLEIPKEVRAHWIAGSEKTYHILVWIGCGLVKGSVMTVARIGSGLWDVASFPFAVPAGHAPLLKPDYVFDQWPQRQEGVVYKNLGDK